MSNPYVYVVFWAPTLPYTCLQSKLPVDLLQGSVCLKCVRRDCSVFLSENLHGCFGCLLVVCVAVKEFSLSHHIMDI